MLQSPQILRRKRALLALGGALIGLILFLAINTAASLDVTNDRWLAGGYVEKDILQHYAGWLFYRASPLTFPLGIAQQMNYPYGLAVSYTDSVPLFAILFRLLSPILPATFQYFGIVTLLFYMLQGAAAAMLLSLFSESVPAVLAGTVLFTASPILLERSFRHTALAAHFLLLTALYLYFQNRRAFRRRASWLVLLGLATAIHPYFLPMLFALFFADLLEQAVHTRHFAKPAGFLLAGFGVVLAVGWVIGIFSTSASGNATGYGYFCMNLNTLYCPVSTNGILWSRLIGQRPQALGSADGFNYLGLGVLAALLPCGLLWLRREGAAGVRAFCRRHWALGLVCLCLTAFAVSTTVLFGGAVVFSVSLPAGLESLCSMFRSSGRMFWPVYYLLYLFVFVNLARTRPAGARWLPAVLAVALAAVQLWDMEPALAYKRTFFTEHRVCFVNPLDSALWDNLAGHYRHFFSLDDLLYQGVYPALYAAENGMSTNDGFAARYDAESHQAAVAEVTARLEAGEYDPDTLYATSNFDTFLALARKAGDAAWAVRADDCWYLLIPKKAGVTVTADADTAVYPNFPPEIADYTDDNWTSGVLNSNPAVVLFADNELTHSWLDGASVLCCGGAEYRILARDSSDPGWIMVTLDIPDASVLAGQTLTAQ